MQVAVAQIEPKLGELERNLECCQARMEEAASAGAEFLVLPECAISRYMFDAPSAALAVAEEIPGPLSPRPSSASAAGSRCTSYGLLERDGTRSDATRRGSGGPAFGVSPFRVGPEPSELDQIGVLIVEGMPARSFCGWWLARIVQ
jgi:predicted amidohydrolase